MKKMYQITKIKFALIVLIAFATSCSKDKAEETVDANKAGIKLTLTETEFVSNELPVTKASTNSTATKPFNITKEVQSGPFTITAELTETTPASSGLKASTNKAATKLLSLRGAVRYRIVAFETDGTYVDQAIGDASNANQVFFGDKLIVGHKYNFFIYSMGSTTQDPEPVSTGTNMYLANDAQGLRPSFNYNDDGGDYMCAVETDVTILGNNTPTPLTTPLQHMFTRVTIQVDNSDATGTFGQVDYKKGGYNSEVAVNGSIDYSNGMIYSPVIDMSTGKVASGFNQAPDFLPLQNLGTTPKTVLVNQLGVSNFSLSLNINAGSIKIGHDVNQNVANFSFSNGSQGLKPGYAYTLKLRFNSDRYVNANNETRTATAADALYAVIGGYRWDRYNLGAGSLNPSSGNLASASTQALHGNFYQWGQKAIVANAITSGDGPIAGWNNNVYLPANSWNSGTESLPVKVTANDPCSAGTRIPTMAEFERLSTQTNWTTQGTWGDVSTLANLPGYDAAMAVTSKKSGDINLIFPAAGRRELNSGQLSLRGREGYYATSMESSTNTSFNNFFLIRAEPDVSISAVNKPVGINVRCIQDK
ncbi:hypothetical protein [Sphingobacterium sp.]|uniref:hypothetical protein n=1 Tax=Sphingobacterium sp. TaxID=341027 RepID=UPI0028B11412|nr:hypothetical protein [Sphingobacterium sp.]